MKLIFLLYFLSLSFLVLAHEGHNEKKIFVFENVQEKNKDPVQEGISRTWIMRIGSVHLILLHFPIALINMLAIAEVLLAYFRKPMFEHASHFMLISTAILAPPTALLGFIYSYSVSYGGVMETFLYWHMWFGILTAIFAVAVMFIRERTGKSSLYYFCLALLILMVNITGFFGGEMTFGSVL